MDGIMDRYPLYFVEKERYNKIPKLKISKHSKTYNSRYSLIGH
jgi:hypothetical protein